jgi:hypothetical protein
MRKDPGRSWVLGTGVLSVPAPMVLGRPTPTTKVLPEPECAAIAAMSQAYEEVCAALDVTGDARGREALLPALSIMPAAALWMSLLIWAGLFLLSTLLSCCPIVCCTIANA